MDDRELKQLVPRYHDAETAMADTFCVYAARAVQNQGGKALDVDGYLAVLKAMRADLRVFFANGKKARRHAPAEQRQAADVKDRALRAELEAQIAARERMIHDIRNQPRDERERQLKALHENYIVRRGLEHIGQRLVEKLAPVPAAPPDWQAVRGTLDKASSEQAVLNLETAWERGGFKTSAFADYPIADISGRVGNQHMTAHAELRSDLDTPEARKIMHTLAEQLADPRLGLGPRVQQTVQALMRFWLESRTKDGFAVVSIQQLAQALGYERGAHGYHPDHYEQIRRFVDTAKYASLQVKDQERDGTAARLTGAAYNIEYIDDAGARGTAPSKGWTAITFRPGLFLTRAATHEGALLMGFDPELNRLNPKNERGPLLLAKYLERHFRFNWNNAPGRIERRVRTLLTDGMGLTDAAVSKPNIETRNALEAALEKLEELGTVKAWQGDSQWQAVDGQLEPLNGRPRRMTRGLWQVALESMVTIEAGQKYERHYIEHGLTYQGDAVNPLVRDLREHIAETGRTQAAIAGEIGVTPSQLSKVLSGKRRISPELAARIETLIRQGKTLPLFGNGER